MKKILSVTLALVILFSFAACSKSGTQSVKDGDSDTLAAITGCIAWAYYRQFGMPISPDLQKMQEKVYT